MQLKTTWNLNIFAARLNVTQSYRCMMDFFGSIIT